ncbi:MAG: hypothetical protein AB2691_08970, partial [Candidatus Thiodiazotropha sp.]
MGPTIERNYGSIANLHYIVIAGPDDAIRVWGGKSAVEFFCRWTPGEGAREHHEMRPGPRVVHSTIALGSEATAA